MKRISIIVDDDIEQIAVTTYHRDFPGAETFDIGSEHSLNIDNGDVLDLRICPDEKTVMDLVMNEKQIEAIRNMVIHGIYSIVLKKGYDKAVFVELKEEQNRLFENYIYNINKVVNKKE